MNGGFLRSLSGAQLYHHETLAAVLPLLNSFPCCLFFLFMSYSATLRSIILMYSRGEQTREDVMIKVQSQFVQQTLGALALVLFLGALAMIWPTIIALLLGALLLLQSCGAEQEITVLSWTEVGNWPIVLASLRRPGLPAILS